VKQASEQVKQAQVSLAQAQANRANNEIRRRDVEIAQASGARSEAMLTNANDTLSQTTVRSPIDAVVLQKYVEQGTIITSGQSLNATGTSIVQMGDISKMYVNVSVDETDLSGVTEGQPVKITVDAYKNIGFEGKVARINPQAQVENNVTTFAVRVEVDNSNPSFRLLRPGMNATCVFLSDSREDVVSLPSQAIHTDDQGSYVEIAKGGAAAPRPSSDGQSSRRSGGGSARGGLLTGVKVERRLVETGLEGNGVVEIVDGLQEGEKVVVQTIVPTQNRPAAAAGGSPFGGSGGGRGGVGGSMGGGRSGGGGSRR
jgi:HlyD family secretion protein